MKSLSSSRGTAILIVGDLLAYIFSLVFTLLIRYAVIPGRALLLTHISAFWILFVVFLVINFSAGLYDKQLALIRNRIQGLLLRAQIVNAILGIMYFYFVPGDIAPKFNLVLYFVISTAILYIWRLIMFPVVTVTRKQSAIIIGSGPDVTDLYDEIDENIRYGISFKTHIKPSADLVETKRLVAEALTNHHAALIVADLHDPMVEKIMPYLYSLVFSGAQVIDVSKLYETVFDRIPLSITGERWLVENSSTALGARTLYDSLKRVIDIAIGSIALLISFVAYPFVYAAIKIDDGGAIFIDQKRVGKNGKIVTFYKFRSMSGNDQGKYGTNGTTTHHVTRVGKFLRRSRIDELPQLWNVVKGDLSLIGPRPEFPALVNVYEKEIPYYGARHLVKPGLSGWAQIYHEAHPHHAVATEETRDKLSYDLYYIKNRSLTLDIKIILRTLEILLKRAGK